MLKLSLYGFEFYLIGERYAIFYFDTKLPRFPALTLDDAIFYATRWIDSQGDWYMGCTSAQLQEKYDTLERV